LLNRWLEYWRSHAGAEHSAVLGAVSAATAAGSVVLQGIVILILPKNFFLTPLKFIIRHLSELSRNTVPPTPLPAPPPFRPTTSYENQLRGHHGNFETFRVDSEL